MKLVNISGNIFLIFCFGFFMGCHPDKETKKVYTVNENTLKQQFIKANQQVVQKENDDMDAYEKSHAIPFIRTNSGVRYFISKPSANGERINDSCEVTMEYNVSLLDGTECYSSDKLGLKTFVVDAENIESGIHIGAKYLKNGDRAILLIPSHLAHGLLGDMNKIPPQMPIVYEVHITGLRKILNN